MGSFGMVMPFVAMVVVQCLDMGMSTLAKTAMSRGLSNLIFVFYVTVLSTIILFPSFIFQRKACPPLTLHLLCRFFLLGLVGSVMGNCLASGINYSSPTLASAIGNLTPAFTFMLAVIFRLEKLDMVSPSSQAKVLGTLVSISGAMVITFYKGPPVSFWWPSSSSDHSEQSPLNSLKEENWVLGALLLAAGFLSSSISNIFQAQTLEVYPARTVIVFFTCFFTTLLNAVVTLIAEKDPSAWKLSLDIELVSIVLIAVFGRVIPGLVIIWCIQKKGPLFVAFFSPLGITIAAIMGVIFLADTLHLGSVIGAILISVGFYGAIWGQAKEEEMKGKEHVVHSSDSSRTPLLLKNKIEV
ncbi:WAT1-related protein At5g40240-like isoform X2 [Tasmannia lanceolata]|uniref:WAT1-related protein At5g40240-like isoform X2 n=1 Tax=Tasmannia lanceolata TaxID=3420 RepID=UPI004063C507